MQSECLRPSKQSTEGESQDGPGALSHSIFFRASGMLSDSGVKPSRRMCLS